MTNRIADTEAESFSCISLDLHIDCTVKIGVEPEVYCDSMACTRTGKKAKAARYREIKWRRHRIMSSSISDLCKYDIFKKYDIFYFEITILKMWKLSLRESFWNVWNLLSGHNTVQLYQGCFFLNIFSWLSKVWGFKNPSYGEICSYTDSLWLQGTTGGKYLRNHVHNPNDSVLTF